MFFFLLILLFVLVLDGGIVICLFDFFLFLRVCRVWLWVGLFMLFGNLKGWLKFMFKFRFLWDLEEWNLWMGGIWMGVEGIDCVELFFEGGLYEIGGWFDVEFLCLWWWVVCESVLGNSSFCWLEVFFLVDLFVVVVRMCCLFWEVKYFLEMVLLFEFCDVGLCWDC